VHHAERVRSAARSPSTHRADRDRLALPLISAITPEGQLLMQVQDHAYPSVEVVGFLRHLLRIYWASADYLEWLPGYAPELKPDEGNWQELKRVELKNVVCHDLVELRYELRLATARLRHKHHLI
jgi:hypothetical protein